ncbi:MAG: formimidoylglutamate deiminase [Kangiellaceae bacterium]|jgi:formimidoylglutamate deiminase|nr:formimidoylglutamate deiminase [Kangiellaceae bacterium]
MNLFAEKILLSDGWASDVTLEITNGIISSIKQGKANNAETVDGPVIPGMANLHSHAFQKAFVGMTEFRTSNQDSFWSWRDSMYRLLVQLTPEQLKTVGEYLYLQMLSFGYTSCAEFHYLHHQPNGVKYDDPATMSKVLVDAADNVGIGFCICPVFYHYAGFNHQPAEQQQLMFTHSVDEFQALVSNLKTYTSDFTDSRVGIAPHSLRAVSKEQLDELTDWWQGPIHIHIAEQMKEVNECMEFYQARPIEWLMDNYAIDSNWCLVHATHANQTEVQAMAKQQAVVGLCPATEANLGDGLFNMPEFVGHNGLFGIGSDSQISLSSFKELQLLEYGQRLNRQKRNLLATEQLSHVGRYLWQNAAINGSKVLDRKAGAIEVGYKADLVILDPTIPELSFKQNDFIIDTAIFACDENPVKDVMVAGEWKISGGRHKQQESIINNYRQLMKLVS